MTNDILQNKTIAILVDDGFEQVEMTVPRQAVEEVGARTLLVSPQQHNVRAWQHTDWGNKFPVDLSLQQARAQDFDALILPGGVINADHLRMNQAAVRFVRAFFEQGKPVAVICHAPWLLIEAGVVSGRKMTAYASLQTDLRNAGARWANAEVIVDAELVTSRNPDDLPAFTSALIEVFAHEHGREREYNANPGQRNTEDTEDKTLRRSTAPNASFEEGGGARAPELDTDPAHAGGAVLSNPEIENYDHLDPYYPPGGGGTKSGKPRSNEPRDERTHGKRNIDEDREKK